MLHVGIRFPLGVASAGLVMLAHLGDAEIAEYLDRVDLAAAWGVGHAADDVLRRVDDTRRLGYAVNPGLVVEGSWGMAAAVFDARGRAEWAVTLTGVERRFDAERRPALGRELLECAHALSGALKRAPHP